jgi:hypothetical protein
MDRYDFRVLGIDGKELVMGWVSAGEIFYPVARALIELEADDETKRSVLGILITKLQEGDWDTGDESLDKFRDDPVIVSLLMERGVLCCSIDGRESYAEIVYTDDGRWTLMCSDRACGWVGAGVGATWHDRLVRLWVAHDRDVHGGDGEVPEWALIYPTVRGE